VRITSEPYANAIIVTANSPEMLGAVEAVLKELDVPTQAGETTFRVGLRFAKASTVANNINILFARGGSPPLRQTPQQGQPNVQNPQQQQQGNATRGNFELEQEVREETYYPWLGGQPENFRTSEGRNTIRPVSDLVGRVRIVPDQRGNALLISANLHMFPQVLKLIQELDAPTPQVLIEAKIVEVSSDYLDRLGVRWSPDGGATFTAEDLDNSIIAKTRGGVIQGFGGKSTVNTLSSSGVPNALASLRSGTIDSTINLDFLVQFLRKTTDASVLGEPQINVADNEVGKLFVGQQVPFIERSQSTDVGALNQTFSYKDVGVILEVTPHINTSGDVALKIRAESSAIVPGQTLFGGAILDTRNFKTDLTVKDGQTLVLGGIIQRQVSDTLRKTPILGSIPGLGWAFKKKDKTTREVELMVFLRPKIVRTPEEAQELLEEIDKKAPLIKKWRTDVDPIQIQEPGKKPKG
jgi:general secretion pathway protein D